MPTNASALCLALVKASLSGPGLASARGLLQVVGEAELSLLEQLCLADGFPRGEAAPTPTHGGGGGGQGGGGGGPRDDSSSTRRSGDATVLGRYLCGEGEDGCALMAYYPQLAHLRNIVYLFKAFQANQA